MKPDIDKIMGADKPDEGGDDEASMDLEDGFMDVMDAMKKGDAKSGAAALKNFVDMCAKPDASPEMPQGE